jgi:hypothetical protein
LSGRYSAPWCWGEHQPSLRAPEVPQKSCEAGGGTFARSQGTKTCTPTSTASYTSDEFPNSQTGPFIPGQAYAFVLTGVSTVTDVISTTTTQTQKGNGDVTTVQSATVVSSTVNPVSCTLVIGSHTFVEDNDLCAQNGLFLQPTPLGPIV